MAQYLVRCTGLPLDTAFIIAQHRYGLLEKKDWELIKEYPPEGYKLRAPTNNRVY
jgi:hypothetical protein